MARNELTSQDKNLIDFLARYRIMSMHDAKILYNSEWYYRKRIKKLVDKEYIKRYKYYYIVLSRKGRIITNTVGQGYLKNTKNEAYMDRLKNISNIATISINSNIEFIPSWSVKDRNIFTETARKYVGELKTNNKRYIVYYLNCKKENTYVKQLLYDINKTINYENLMIFVDNYDTLITMFDNFVFNKKSSLIIRNTEENKNIIRRYNKIEFYELLKNTYNRVPLISDWEKADYIVNENHYIINMPFLDTAKISEMNWFYKENINTNKKVDIITLEENINVLKKVLTDRCNINVLPRLTGGCENEEEV